MKAIRIISVLSLIVMAVAIVTAGMAGDFFEEGSTIAALAWGKVTFLDLYVGLLFFGTWIAVREASILSRVAWWAGLVFLGNLAAALYMVLASFSSKSLREFLTGDSS